MMMTMPFFSDTAAILNFQTTSFTEVIPTICTQLHRSKVQLECGKLEEEIVQLL